MAVLSCSGSFVPVRPHEEKGGAPETRPISSCTVSVRSIYPVSERWKKERSCFADNVTSLAENRSKK
jgi:hypothetical protein